LKPSANLSADTTYTATITTAASDVDGNSLDAMNNWSFTTIGGSTSNLLIRLYRNNSLVNYFPSIQTSYNASADNDIIQTRTASLVENLLLNLPVAVTIQGGYDETFATYDGITVLWGNLTVQSGALTVSGLAIH
jgi:hypothetical protein